MKTNRMTKLLCTIILAVLLMPMLTLVVHADIVDISGHWAQEVILEWVEKGLANGYPDGTFRPNNDISRAEFMTLVNVAFGYTEEKEVDYVDVSEGQWYFSTIRKAAAAGYISGYEDGTIKPNNPITREEAATIIARIMKLEENKETIEKFLDKDKIKWSRGYVGAVVDKEYMVGFPDGTFKPQKNITRGEAVFALNNIISNDELRIVQALAKQDFLGITYIRVTLNPGANPSAIKANEENLVYDSSDGKWKGTALDLEIGDAVEISVLDNGVEETVTVVVEDMGSN